jgi:hypothetical protein
MKHFLTALTVIVFCSCSSTNVSVSPALTTTGKSILIQAFTLKQTNKNPGRNTDSVCTCTGQAIEKAIIPYLQQKGFSVYTLTSPADSLKLPANIDYVLVGSGSVHMVGSSTFVQGFSVELKNKGDNGTLAAASFTGVSIRAPRAGDKIGKALAAKMK